MRRLTVVVATLLVVTLTAGLVVAAPTLRALVRPPWNSQRVLTVLVVGSDVGPPHRRGNPLKGRADAIHLIAVDTKRRRATIVDFPRDSLIGGTKVNAHLALGGLPRLRRVLERYTGIGIDYHAMTTFTGLRSIVKQMGGVEVDVDQRMVDRFSRSNIKPGRQKLGDFKALAYTRNRKSLRDGDFGRTRNQGKLLRAAHRQVSSRQSDLVSLTKLTGTVLRNVETDIPRNQFLRFAVLATSIKSKHVRQVPLKGGAGMRGGASVVFLRPGSTFKRIRQGKIGR